MLIFNEKTQYDNLMANGFEKFPNKRDLLILCRQWIKDGITKKDLVNEMVSFCNHFNSQFNYAKSENLLISVVNEIEKQEKEPPKFNFQTNIVVFQSEIDRIKELKDKKLQKVAFVMMCLAKWRNTNYVYLNSQSSIKPKEIFTLAGVKATGKEQLQALYQLNSCGFTDVQLKPIDKFIIPSICFEGDSALNFTIDEKMIEQWQNLVNPHCERCGCWFEKQGNKQKYCKECAKKIKNEQNKQYLKLGK